MKIYIQDHSWAGGIVVVASSEEEAIELMKHDPTNHYDPKVPLESFDITPGVIYHFWGDS